MYYPNVLFKTAFPKYIKEYLLGYICVKMYYPMRWNMFKRQAKH